jgi:hypothetical protein
MALEEKFQGKPERTSDLELLDWVDQGCTQHRQNTEAGTGKFSGRFLKN